MANGSSANEVFLQKLNQIVQAKLSDSEFGVNELAREMGMSRSNLHRRVSEMTGKTVVSIIAEARLKYAVELLKEETYTVSEVAWKAGFGSATYFNKCFSDYFGFPPGEAAKRDLSVPQKVLKKEVKSKSFARFELKKILIGGIILVAVLNILLFVFLVLPLNRKPENQPKSVAVLPFINDSRDTANIQFINGVMDGIITNLSKIEDLTVLPRTSVEQYRLKRPGNNRQIAEELDVSYIVDGSGQKIGDQLKVTVNLIEGKTNKLLFSEPFDRKWEDVFDIQSEIATLIANRIEAKITHEESERINTKPTNNIAAYNLVLKAIEIPWVENKESNLVLLKESEKLLREAIRLDSTYSEAYVQLGWNLTHQEKNFDTILHLVDRALHFDVKNGSAYYLKGWFYLYQTNELQHKEAEEVFNLVTKYSKGSKEFSGLGQLHSQNGEFYEAIQYYLKGLETEKNPEVRYGYIYLISRCLFSMGLYEEASIIARQQIDLKNDSSAFLDGVICKAMEKGDLKTAYQNCLKLKSWDFALPYLCLFSKDYEKALLHLEEQSEIKIKNGNPVYSDFNKAAIYLKNGMKEKGEAQLKESLKFQESVLKKAGQDANQWDYIELAGNYCGMGNRKMALETLVKSSECKNVRCDIIYFTVLKYSPAFELIAEEPVYKQFVKTAENKLSEEQAKIRKLIKNRISELN